MTDEVFAELDRAVGPVAMMSLQSRGLCPPRASRRRSAARA